ncbi:MAG TPA: TolC family protein [Chitinophagales bacterium]|nr:TolC family protein [Chitinophagales bacterium]
MKPIIRYFFLMAFLLPVFCGLKAQTDTTHTLSVSDFIDIVKKYHPVAKQSDLISQQAREELNIARGGWDPLIYSDYDSKTFNGSNYYSYFESSVKIPTWYGIEVKAGYDFAYGNEISSEHKLPNDGLGYLGISVPLGRNLLLDRRRATLRQAQIFKQASEQQRLVILNDLLLDALEKYYEWSYAYFELEIYKAALLNAIERFEATKKLAAFGDRPNIDTVEAMTQVQSRQFQVNDAQLNFLNKSLELGNYLWLENDLARPVDTSMVPEVLQSNFVEQVIQLNKMTELETAMRQNHPQLLNYNLKLKQLDIERRLKIENLKPILNVNYNLLSQRFNFQKSEGLIFTNNYKFGLNFAMPLTFMQGRGELKLAKIKIADTRYQLNLKTQELVTKLKSYFNELINLQAQTKLYEASIDNWQKLADGENARFRNGESSMFLVNARENKLIESQLKLRELQAKYFKTEAAVKWAAGIISN